MAAGPTYEPIATTTLTSNTSDYTFTSIPGTYTDLIVVCSNLKNTTTHTLCLRFNSDTSTNYSWTVIAGALGSASSQRASNDSRGVAIGGYTEGLQSGTPGIYTGQVMNYSNSTTYKTCIARGNNTNGEVETIVGLWRSTAAITSITVRPSGGFMQSGTVLSLYGIKAA